MEETVHVELGQEVEVVADAPANPENVDESVIEAPTVDEAESTETPA